MYLLIVIYLCLLGSTQYKESMCVFCLFLSENTILKKSILVGLIHCTDLKEPSVDGKMVQADHTDARRVNN